MPSLSTDRLSIAYRDEGPHDAPVALLIHGWPDDASTWDEVYPHLNAAGLRTIVPALRGFGDTRFLDAETPRTGNSGIHALDMIALMDALGIERFMVAGHDWGANIGEALAVGWPARVERLAMLATPPRLGGMPTPPFWHAQLQWYHWFMATARGAQAMRDDRRGFAHRHWVNWGPPGWFREATFQRVAASWDNPDWVDVTLHSYRTRWDEAEPDPASRWLEDKVKATQTLSLPVIYVQGGADGVNPPAASSEVHKKFNGPFEYVELPGVGHFIQREAPAEVARHLVKLFGGDAAASATEGRTKVKQGIIAALALAGAAAVAALAASSASAQAGPLTQVARFDHQVTGVAVTADGRRFVNFPRWTDDAPLSVAEVLKDGTLRAYPDAHWNSWRNARVNELPVGNYFVCVQSIGRTGYITDSGTRGAIIVVDLTTGHGWRALDGHASTQIDKAVKIAIDGKPLVRPDGRQPAFAADGIALSNDGQTLYYQALTGRTLYSIATDKLREGVPEADRAAAVKTVATTTVADGLWMSKAGTLYITSPTDYSIKRLAGGGTQTVLTDRRLRWPDTFSEGPDGTMYVTASHIQDTQWFTPGAPPAIRTELFSFPPAP